MISKESVKAAVDAAIFTIHEGKLKVLLHTREKEPFKGKKELPGGLLLKEETAEETLSRKLKQLLGQENIFAQQFYTFTDPQRDPRERTVSIGFISLISEDRVNKLVSWYEYNEIKDMAFDHKKILQAAREYLKANTAPSLIKNFMPKTFPLNKLQEVYEIIEGKKYDNRNFRKKMITSRIVEETKQLEKEVSHRPAKLFKFK